MATTQWSTHQRAVLTLLGCDWVTNYACRFSLVDILGYVSLGNTYKVSQLGNKCDQAILSALLSADGATRAKIDTLMSEDLQAQLAHDRLVRDAERVQLQQKIPQDLLGHTFLHDKYGLCTVVKVSIGICTCETGVGVKAFDAQFVRNTISNAS